MLFSACDTLSEELHNTQQEMRELRVQAVKDKDTLHAKSQEFAR